ncbi:hypothetical protein QAD02_006835 [Eretmocerus hayati]|uniref:Uncharacterized protein n=1 Tax=Eretmocerus hayati TaxID=131215 RepID=A0ACC2N2F2_9HYME|nr:hypothetical protein QAD02_006835 [Eretmocerus hayati]
MTNVLDYDEETRRDETRSKRVRERERDLLSQTFAKEKLNRYDKDSNGPFLVHVFDTQGNLGNFHISEFGLTLYKANVPVIDLHRAGPMRYALKFETGEQANKFVESQVQQVKNHWRAFIPDTGLYKIGLVHRVSKDIPEHEILEGLDPESRSVIRKVERIISTVDSSKGKITYATDKIKIYAVSHLPRNIRLFWSIYRDVEYFVPAVLRCYHCQRYGYGASVCRNAGRCVYCGDNHPGDCRNPIKCPNCRRNHQASDRECVFFIFNSEVNFVMSQKKVCRAEAISMVQENYRRKFKANYGKDVSDVLYEGPNPYINKRDLLEQRGLFTFDEENCDEHDDGIAPETAQPNSQQNMQTDSPPGGNATNSQANPLNNMTPGVSNQTPSEQSPKNAPTNTTGSPQKLPISTNQSPPQPNQSNSLPARSPPKTPTDLSTTGNSEFDHFENQINKEKINRGPTNDFDQYDEYENEGHTEQNDYTSETQSHVRRQSRPRHRGNSYRSRSPHSVRKYNSPPSEKGGRNFRRR